MARETYRLKISVEVLSFFNITTEYTYFQGPLYEIDKKTSIYKDAKSFFYANKIYIERRIKSDFENEYGFSPTEIDLGENGVYIVRIVDGVEQTTKPLRPLFKKIAFADKEYDLSDIIKNKLYKGNIKYFYECDQFREALGEYDSFFYGLEQEVLNRVARGDYSASDIVWIWDWIKYSKRMCQLMRFLLMDLEHFEGNINEYYFELIPSREEPKIISKQNEERLYTYRHPYKDD